MSLGTSIFCLSLNTVILQEHSNSPFTHPGAFSSLPVTRRSILQHQRCRPPLFERTIRRRVRWPGWTMLEMTFLASVCLPLSLTFAVYDCWWGGGQRSKRLPTTPPPTCRCAVFTAFPGCGPDGKQTLFAYLKSPSRQNSSFLPLLHLNDVQIDACVHPDTVFTFAVHKYPVCLWKNQDLKQMLTDDFTNRLHKYRNVHV